MYFDAPGSQMELPGLCLIFYSEIKYLTVCVNIAIINIVYVLFADRITNTVRIVIINVKLTIHL